MNFKLTAGWFYGALVVLLCAWILQDFHGDARGVGGRDEAVGHRGKGDAHATGSRSGDAGERRHGDRLVD